MIRSLPTFNSTDRICQISYMLYKLFLFVQKNTLPNDVINCTSLASLPFEFFKTFRSQNLYNYQSSSFQVRTIVIIISIRRKIFL